MASQELAISYAALILADEGVAITPEKMQKLLEAANVEVEPIWTVLFAKAIQGKDIKELLLNISGGGPAAPTVTEAPSNTQNRNNKDQENKKEGKKEEEAKDESDDDMGFGLFD